MYLLYNGFEILACILSYFFILYLADRFFYPSNHYSIWIILIMGCLYLIDVGYPFQQLSNITVSFLSMLICWFTLHIIFQGKWWHKLLFVVCFNLCDILIGSAVTSIFLLLFPQSIDSLTNTGSYQRILYLSLIYLTEFIIIFFVRLQRKRAFILSIKESILSAIFLVCDFLVTVLILYFLIYYSGSDKIFPLLCLFADFLIIAISIIGLYLLEGLHCEHMENMEKQNLNWQLSLQESALTEYQKKYDAIRSIKHDMKRYLINYRNLLESGDSVLVLNSINAILNEPLITDNFNYTENSLLNTLICEKQKVCEECNTLFQNRIVLNPMYKNIEYMVLISNLLDNAIEAERKVPVSDRLVQFELVENDNRISLIVKNYIENSILENNPHLHTTKEPSSEHGFGLRTTKKIVDSNNGFIRIYEENQFFIIHVSLPM